MPQPRRLFVHVGLQKTGTSYLQAALLASRDALAEQGLDLVPPSKQESFELMVVVRERYEARRDAESDRNIWDRFARQLSEAPGSRAVFSQESLAAAGPGQIDRFLEACGDREVHVVLTARDLGRQLPSSWQQELKAGSDVTFPAYLERLQAMAARGSGRHPWIHLDPPAVLARWSARLGPDRVHLVTVPPPGSPTTLLLERFASVLEVDPERLTPEERPSNSSLGAVQAEVLRRVNAELPEEVHRRYVYRDVVKRFFGAEVLASQTRRPILVPEGLRPWCEEVTEQQLTALAAAGYRVVGSLADLRCADSAFAGAGGAAAPPSADEVASASVSALATMLEIRGRAEAARRSGRIVVGPAGPRARLRRRLARLRRADGR